LSATPRRRISLYPRKQLDIRWSDLAAGFVGCISPGDLKSHVSAIEQSFAPGEAVLVTFSVRSSLDLCLQALALPRGSEVLMTALTIREMADIVRKNGLVPIPLDLELETLAPALSTVESAITPKTRAIIVAHLFGTRVPMDPIVELAKRNNLFVIEDCAQAFTGREYTGHPQGDLAMFSFGSIKTSTALGGALVRAKDPQFLHKMRAIQASYPLQSRDEHLKAVFTHVCVKLFTVPLIYGLFYRACAAMEKDFDQVINAVRGLPEEEEEQSLDEIRKQPSGSLVALLARRLRTFDAAGFRKRTEIGSEFAKSLPPGLSCLGGNGASHSFWVFPVLVEAPERFASALRSYGFDATTAGSALSVIDPPANATFPVAAKLRAAYQKLIYLPVYPKVPRRARARLREALAGIQSSAPHLQLIDARRIYSAHVQTVESPRTIADIRDILCRAKSTNATICMMGAGHNLGGHAFTDGSICLDLKSFQRVLSLDVGKKRITVQSGITWDKIQKVANPAGLAVMAMQSDNIFTVGGSLSANAHGRDVRFTTLIQSVIGFRLMHADGSIVSASRTENPDLFRLVIGGYGLFGIILDVDLALVDNCLYKQKSEVVSIHDLPNYFRQRVLQDSNAALFLARPSISPTHFLDDTIVTVWRNAQPVTVNALPLDRERNIRRDRFLFDLSRKYPWGKRLRWHAEKYLSRTSGPGELVSRNNAMRPPVSAVKMFEHNSPTDTDSIHEFFIPVPRFLQFMQAISALFRESQTNLLGVTIRYVKSDAESLLSYAPKEEAFAVIIYINESLSAEGRTKAHDLIQRMNRLAVQHEGTFYLTYARDISFADLQSAYPAVDMFFREKHRVDPEHRFTSWFFQLYQKQSLEQGERSRAATA